MALKYTEANINTLHGLAQIRNNTGMYFNIALTEVKAQSQIIKEYLDNAVDEATSDPTHHYTVKLTVLTNGKRYQCIIEDNARGVPIGSLEACFTIPHTGSKGKSNKRSAYRASIGLHGCGSKLGPATGNVVLVMSKRDRQLGILRIKEAKVISNTVEEYKSKTTGTIVLTEPDGRFLSDVDKFMTHQNGYGYVIELIKFYDAYSSNITFEVYLGKKLIPYNVLLHSTDVYDIVTNHDKHKLIDIGEKLSPIEYCINIHHLSSGILWQTPKIVKEIQYDIPHSIGMELELFLPSILPNNTSMVGSINLLPNHGNNSSHIQLLSNRICERLSKHISDKDVKIFIMNKYKLPIAGSILIWYDEAEFVGQNKSQFSMAKFMSEGKPQFDMILDQLDKNVWAELYILLENNIRIQFDKYMKRIQLTSDLKNSKCYLGCRSRDNTITELLITEGKSAGGIVVQARDSNTQAVFKLKGVPLNSFKKDIVRNDIDGKIVTDAILSDLIKILGVTSRDTNLDNMNFARIGILADADFDGYHISALVVGNLYKINPRIIEEGRVFVSNPPLYIFGYKNSRQLLLRDWCALLDTKISKVYSNIFEISIVNNMTNKSYVLQDKALRDFLYYIVHVGGVIDHMATELSITAEILELMVYVVDELETIDTVAIKNKLGMDRVIYDPSYDSIVLTYQNLDIPIQLNALVHTIRANVLPEMDRIRWRDITLLVAAKSTPNNNERYNISMLYSKLKQLDKLCNIRRFKGLSEMNIANLELTCVNPLTRSIRTITRVGDVDRLYSLLGTKTDARRDLIIGNII